MCLQFFFSNRDNLAVELDQQNQGNTALATRLETIEQENKAIKQETQALKQKVEEEQNEVGCFIGVLSPF